jgi:hypothetical protein
VTRAIDYLLNQRPVADNGVVDLTEESHQIVDLTGEQSIDLTGGSRIDSPIQIDMDCLDKAEAEHLETMVNMYCPN